MGGWIRGSVSGRMDGCREKEGSGHKAYHAKDG